MPLYKNYNISAIILSDIPNSLKFQALCSYYNSNLQNIQPSYTVSQFQYLYWLWKVYHYRAATTKFSGGLPFLPKWILNIGWNLLTNFKDNSLPQEI